MSVKKIIIFITVLGVILLTFILVRSRQQIPYSLEETQNQITTEEPITEIKIYDIEEGFLTVPFNNNAIKHAFNWANLTVNDNGYYSYEDDFYKTKLGIDVSKFQGNIDWKKVKESGVEFVMIRLGFRGYGEKGNIVLDSTFEKNAKEASKEGLEVGIYFFSQAISEDEAIEEANYVLDKIKNKNITYPICFDLEKIKYDTARTDNLTSEEITKIALAFCNRIKEAGYEPLVYGNSKTFTTRMQLEKLNDYQKWYADYLETPLYPYAFNMWQYTEEGTIAGINGNVDINLHFIPKK